MWSGPPAGTRRIQIILDIEGTGQWMTWSEHFGAQLWEFFYVEVLGYYLAIVEEKVCVLKNKTTDSCTTIDDE